METTILTTVAASVVLGALGQLLASIFRLPAIVFLLLLGMVAGQQALGIVQPKSLGHGLPVITSMFVAIILFEGAFTLRPKVLREAMQPVRRLITVGALVTMGGAAVLAHLILELPWSVAFLFSSLIVVTGPTVIAPILRRVPLQPRLHAVLKSESILIDPIGVLLAVVVLQYVVGLWTQQADWTQALRGFFERAGLGLLVGGGLGLAAIGLLQLPFFRSRENEHLITLGALGLALSSFALAESWQTEAGVMAVTVAGLILAAVSVPFRHNLEKFKELLTILGVSVLFILLAAGVDLRLLRDFGWQHAILVLGLVFLVRPSAVFLSTLGTSLTWREKAYLSLLAPRGIVAAAMAGHFAVHLAEHDRLHAQLVEALVFLTIAATVFVQGAWAAPLARLLQVRSDRSRGYLLVGINELSLLLANLLKERGETVRFIDSNPLKCDTARERGFGVFHVDAGDSLVYEDIDLSGTGWLVAMTSNDAINTLACDAAEDWLGEGHVLQMQAKPIGATLRSRVRMAGRWAFPSPMAHLTICIQLQEGSLRIHQLDCADPLMIGPQITVAQGPMIPLLILEGKTHRLALEGQICPAGGKVLGLVPSDPASPHA